MQSPRKPRILVANDDGVGSTNLHALAGALSQLGEVFVFAPEVEQSGVSHAFTVRRPLRVHEVSCDEGFRAFSLDGTPADCVKFALGHYAAYGLGDTSGLGPGPFDVCFSGINAGENSGVSSLYSGTVAGAREAALWGVPGIALSLRGSGEDMLRPAIDFAAKVVRERLFEKIPAGVFWNVNFPKSTVDAFKGFRATRMALGMFTDHYAHDGEMWQLDGDKLWEKQPTDSDDYLLHQGYATITPHRIDQTDEKSLKMINEMLAETPVDN
ncbi:5'/3'-nucleotidase SurE [Fibrobacter sp. UWR2]|uniref:5'/3'-nucleotidase SurE n=1 Tax=Fibrobacter sp. UWR2 TaxID=1964352 RepID=UPI000B51FE01|nr:5'/3'-nucleotidase SurE [Fibrobacter sp. UWR2]OWU99763.1 5'/3'-nucleotidase SurE [Fibrobacter sp. UWR2]